MTAIGRAGEVVVFSKMGCHLCEAVEAEIRSIRIIGTGLQVVYIDENPVLHDQYWLRVPVVQIEGRDVFEANMIDLEGEWKKKLARLLDK